MSQFESDSSYDTTESSDGLKDNDPKQIKRIEALVQNLPVLGANFNVLKKIGAGTFSCVYLAESKVVDEFGRKAKVAIKHLVPTCHPNRVIRELRCLQEIGGHDYVGGIKMCLRNKDCIAFIMPYQQHDRFSEYFMEMDAEETKHYIIALLIALRRVHEHSVIHRDVKPSNFLYNRKERKYLLVDFGLAQKLDENVSKKESLKRKRDDGDNEDVNSPLVKRPALQCLNNNVPSNNMIKSVFESRTKTVTIAPPNKGDKLFAKPLPSRTLSEKCDCDGKPQVCKLCLTRKSVVSPRAGTPGFRPPEVLLKYPNQTGAVDIWAVGIILLSILSRTYPFFKSPDDVTALAEMIAIFGSERVKHLARRLGRNIIVSSVTQPFKLKPLCMSLARKRCAKYFAEDNKIIPTIPEFPDSAYDLLTRLLDIDPFTRITACEALNHPFLC